MKTAVIAVTQKGEETSLRIAEHLEKADIFSYNGTSDDVISFNGSLSKVVKKIFLKYDALIFVTATGIAVRSIAPCLKTKTSDPAVLVIDECAKNVISLVSGHIGGANRLSSMLAKALGAHCVITTASDLQNKMAVDTIAEKLHCRISDFDSAKKVSADIVNGKKVALIGIDKQMLPGYLLSDPKEADSVIVVSPLTRAYHYKRYVQLVPRELVIGIGFKKGKSKKDLVSAVKKQLKKTGFHPCSVKTIASVELKKDDKSLCSCAKFFDAKLDIHSLDELKTVEDQFKQSEFVKSKIGVGAVSEPSAWLSGDKKGEMILPKTRVDGVTVAIWRNRPSFPSLMREHVSKKTKGKIYVVGIGPGNHDHITPAVIKAIEKSDSILGYTKYIELLGPLCSGKEIVQTPMRREIERCRQTLSMAESGKCVSLVSSGDAGIYGMVGIMLELIDEKKSNVEVEIIPGITAVSAAAALAGAPLMHDFAVISLSDLLTDLELIFKRVSFAAEADFVIALYNPKSTKRQTQIEEARKLMLLHKSPDTPVAIVRNAMRTGQECTLSNLENFTSYEIDMFSVVIIGNKSSRVSNGRFITPRGYKL